MNARPAAMPALLCALRLALALAAADAAGAQCTVSTQGIAFGEYDALAASPADSAAMIDVSCDVATAYSVALSPGSGTFAQRKMTSGPHALAYNLYLDFARTSVWGDGTGGTGVANGNAASALLTVYGRIPTGQNAHVGIYADQVVVTLTF